MSTQWTRVHSCSDCASMALPVAQILLSTTNSGGEAAHAIAPA